MKVSLIIPCYNEEAGLPNLFRQLEPVRQDLEKAYEVEVLFVDDGSKDNTLPILQKHYWEVPNTVILHHATNKNLGGALRTGFAEATGDIVVTMDSDCTYPPHHIRTLLRLLQENKADIVTASPYHPQGKVENIPAYRLALSRSVSWIYQKLLGSPISTYTCLFRAYRRAILKDLPFESDTFLAVAELLVYALKKGYKVVEFPTVLKPREYGESKIGLSKVILNHAAFILKLAGGRV